VVKTLPPGAAVQEQNDQVPGLENEFLHAI
jgi:hypothetical protein